ncbi:MAG: helix-turn-helix domain-containing protein [Solirubrobacteraceae bacterium]|nr:helix-turn-helix domain-containing protein [Solirubrobacteraceae bacterium]
MSVASRNVDGTEGRPVEEWPYEALVSAIERGTLRDWLPITRAIRRDPWGDVAQQVEEYLAYAAPYGVGPLLRRTIDDARAAHDREERAEIARRIRTLVADTGMTQAAFARAIGTSRSRLSTYCTGSVTPSASLFLRIQRVATRPRR